VFHLRGCASSGWLIVRLARWPMLSVAATCCTMFRDRQQRTFCLGPAKFPAPTKAQGNTDVYLLLDSNIPGRLNVGPSHPPAKLACGGITMRGEEGKMGE